MRCSIHIVTKGRNDSLALLLESLRKQTHKEWDVVILDNNKGAEEVKVSDHFLCQCIFNRLQFEGHRIQVIDNSKDDKPRDIGRYRNMVIAEDKMSNEVGVRIDDDSIAESNYLEILMAPFKQSDIGVVGGIVPYYWQPVAHALLPKKFNEVSRWFEWTDNCINFYRMLDEKGNDKPWIDTFYESGHIRSSYAYRIDMAKKIKFPEWTGSTGFTEETVFCVKVWMEGYKILINPNAILWHMASPYGGGRDTIVTQEQMEKIKYDNFETLKQELTAYRKEKKLEPCAYPC